MLKKSVGKFDSKKWFVFLVVVIILKLIMNLLSLNVLYDVQKSESNLKGELAQAIGSYCSGNADCPSTGCFGTRLMRIACMSGKCDYAHKIGTCDSTDSSEEESSSSSSDSYWDGYKQEEVEEEPDPPVQFKQWQLDCMKEAVDYYNTCMKRYDCKTKSECEEEHKKILAKRRAWEECYENCRGLYSYRYSAMDKCVSDNCGPEVFGYFMENLNDCLECEDYCQVESQRVLKGCLFPGQYETRVYA